MKRTWVFLAGLMMLLLVGGAQAQTGGLNSAGTYSLPGDYGAVTVGQTSSQLNVGVVTNFRNICMFGIALFVLGFGWKLMRRMIKP